MNIEITPMQKLLLDNGYDSGYVLTEEKLQLWEHDEDPPLPLKRPEAQNVVA
tara:strand:+ start:948 stop:1103 length:156 start_codon:yes stop_codon:yes gene_type:complete